MFKNLITYIMSLTVESTEAGNFIDSIVPTVKLSIVLTPLWFVWQKILDWSLNNQDYMLLVVTAIFVDWALGSVKYLVNKNFDLGENAKGLITKLGLAVAGGFLFEGVNYLSGDTTFISESLKIVTRLVVFLYPALSAWKNIHILSGGKFPPKIWIDRSNLFYKTMNPKHLKKEEEDEQA